LVVWKRRQDKKFVVDSPGRACGTDAVQTYQGIDKDDGIYFGHNKFHIGR